MSDAPLVFGKPRGWFSHLWVLLILGVAGTTGQALAGRAGDAMTLTLHYGPARVAAEGLRVVRHKPIVVSNGDAIGHEPVAAVLFAFAAFFATSIGGFFLLRALLPRVDRAAFVAGHKPTPTEYDGSNFVIFLGCTLPTFFTLTLTPKACVAAAMLATAWSVDRRFRRIAGRA